MRMFQACVNVDGWAEYYLEEATLLVRMESQKA